MTGDELPYSDPTPVQFTSDKARIAKLEAALKAADELREEVARRDNAGCHYDRMLVDYDTLRAATKEAGLE